MRILVVTHYFASHGGGVEMTASQLARQLAAAGHSVVWVASDVDGPPMTEAGIDCQPIAAWNVVEELLQAPYPLWCPLQLGQLWREVGRADVVHVHEYVYMGGIAAMLMARLRGKPVVLTQHTGAVRFPARLLTGIYSAANRVLGRLMLGLADQVVFISENVRRYFAGFVRFRRPPRLVHNGLDSSWAPASSDEERRRMRRNLGLDDRDAVLFVGRFVVKKGLDVIEYVVPRVADVAWLMVGDGPVRPEGWGFNQLKVLGRLAPSQLVEVYGAADLLVLPSHTEGFPLVVQEALACGTGVLSTDEVAAACPAATDLLRSAPVPAVGFHRDEWVQALRNVLADREYLNGRSERSRRARALWSWSGCAQAYLDAYASAVEGARR